MAKRKQRLEKKIHELVSRRLKQEFWDEEAQRVLNMSLENFQNQKLSPYRIVEELMGKFMPQAIGETRDSKGEHEVF